MTVPFGPFRLVVSISRRCRELVIPQAVEASDAELANISIDRNSRADRLRWQAEQTLYNARLI